MPDRFGDCYFDTVTLSNFALAGCFDLLVSRYGRRALVTLEVLDEIMDGVVAGYAALGRVEAALHAGRLRCAKPLTSGERVTYRELLHAMSPGEASCIACVQSRGGIVVTDDRLARDCCAERKIRCTGTIGILGACVADGTLTAEAADSLLQAMIAAGYHSPVTRVSGLS